MQSSGETRSVSTVVAYTGIWTVKPVIKDVKLPVRAMMSIGWIPLAVCFLAPAILLLSVSALLTLRYLDSERVRTLFEHLQVQAILLAMILIAMLLLWQVMKLVRDFLRHVIILEVEHDGFTDFRRMQQKIHFDDIEFYNPVYRVRTGQLVAIRFKLKNKPRIVKLPLTLVSSSEPAGVALLALLEKRQISQKPLYDFKLAGLLGLLAFYD
jgi:hypothetical protein